MKLFDELFELIDLSTFVPDDDPGSGDDDDNPG